MAATFQINKDRFVSADKAIEAMHNLAASDVFVTMDKFINDVITANPFDVKVHGSFRAYNAEIAAIIWTAGRLYGKK